jgi:hypothetical protein
MRTFIVTLAATAGLIGAVVSTGAFAAQAIAPPVKTHHATVMKRAQYSPQHRHYQRYSHTDHGYDASDHSAGELNRQQLDHLGATPQ